MLIYDEPINQAKPDPRPAAMPASGGFSVLDLILLLWRRKIMIASAALLCACAASFLALAFGSVLSLPAVIDEVAGRLARAVER